MAQTYSLAIHKADSSRNLLRHNQMAGPRKEVSVSLESTGKSVEACRLTVCHLQSESERQGNMAICPK